MSSNKTNKQNNVIAYDSFLQKKDNSVEGKSADDLSVQEDRTKDIKTQEKPKDKKSKTPSHTLGHRSRLRERFIRSGLDGVSEYELLEIILFGSNPRGDVKPLAKDILKKFGNLYSVITASVDELRKVKGVGDAAVACIKSAHAVAQIMLKQKAQSNTLTINSLESVVEYCQASMSHLKHEEFRVLFLNKKNQLMSDELINSGTINQVAVYPREIARKALEIGAGAIILVHNHPSGNPTPSKEDIEITYKIEHALANLDITLHDHIVIGKGDFVSFKQRKLL